MFASKIYKAEKKHIYTIKIMLYYRKTRYHKCRMLVVKSTDFFINVIFIKYIF